MARKAATDRRNHAIKRSLPPARDRGRLADHHPIKAARSFLLKFDEEGDDRELLEILEEIRSQAPREAELALTVINHLKEGQSGAAQAR